VLISNILEQFISIGNEQTNNPYLPYPLAVDKGIIEEPHVLAKPIKEPAGVTLSNGYIPNAKGAGITKIGDDIAVFDHVSIVDIANKSLTINPTPKEKVTDEGKITGEGIIVIHLPESLIRIARVAIDTQQRPWLAYKLAKGQHIIGKLAVMRINILEFPDYEIKDMNSNDQIIVAKPRFKYF